MRARDFPPEHVERLLEGALDGDLDDARGLMVYVTDSLEDKTLADLDPRVFAWFRGAIRRVVGELGEGRTSGAPEALLGDAAERWPKRTRHNQVGDKALRDRQNRRLARMVATNLLDNPRGDSSPAIRRNAIKAAALAAGVSETRVREACKDPWGLGPKIRLDFDAELDIGRTQPTRRYPRGEPTGDGLEAWARQVLSFPE